MHSSSGNNDLPEELLLEDAEYIWGVYSLMEQTDWRFPPDVLLRQDQRLMSQLIRIRNESVLIERNLENQRLKEQPNE